MAIEVPHHHAPMQKQKVSPQQLHNMGPIKRVKVELECSGLPIKQEPMFLSTPTKCVSPMLTIKQEDDAFDSLDAFDPNLPTGAPETNMVMTDLQPGQQSRQPSRQSSFGGNDGIPQSQPASAHRSQSQQPLEQKMQSSAASTLPPQSKREDSGRRHRSFPQKIPERTVRAGEEKNMELERVQQWRPRRVEDVYRRLGKIGEGTYGSVYKWVDKKTSKHVALKQIKMVKETEGFPVTAVREIKCLKRIDNANVVNLENVLHSNQDEIMMVFEHLDHDLCGLLDSKAAEIKMTSAMIKFYFQEVLRGLLFLHQEIHILHRDIKSSNIFVGNDGRVKLGDFGLARFAHHGERNSKYTKRVVTLWYRSPELLMEVDAYNHKVDMWAAGCLFGELLMGKPLFPGRSEPEQLDLIFQKIGTPTNEQWPEFRAVQAESKVQLKRQYKSTMDSLRKGCGTDAAFDLLSRLLHPNPEKRINAKEALEHPYFTVEEPRAMLKEDHPALKEHYYEHTVRKSAGEKRSQQANHASTGPRSGRHNMNHNPPRPNGSLSGSNPPNGPNGPNGGRRPHGRYNGNPTHGHHSRGGQGHGGGYGQQRRQGGGPDEYSHLLSAHELDRNGRQKSYQQHNQGGRRIRRYQ